MKKRFNYPSSWDNSRNVEFPEKKNARFSQSRKKIRKTPVRLGRMLILPTSAQRCRSDIEKFILENLFSSMLSQKKNTPLWKPEIY